MMPDAQEVVIVDGSGTEHVFPAGFNPKHAAAIVRNGGSSALPTKPVSAEDFTGANRPLLTGFSDAGAAKQFSDPSAMEDLNAAKNRMANVGLLGGAAAMSGLAAGAPLTGALSSGAVRGAGQALMYGGGYYGLKAAGVPAPVADALLIAAGMRGLKGGGGPKPAEAPPPRMIRIGDTVVDRYLPNEGGGPQAGSLQAVPESAPRSQTAVMDRYMPNRGGTPQAGDPGAVATARLPPSLVEQYAPNTSGYVAGQSPGGALVHPTLQESAQATASRAVPTQPTSRPSRPDLAAPEPTDMPRSWHAFLNEEARSSAPAAERQRVQALHKEVAQMDSAYKAATVNEREAWQAMPPDYRDALVAMLRGK